MKIDWLKEKEKLSSLINDGVPYTKIGEFYGVTDNAVKKAATKLGIILKQRRKTNPNETFNKGRAFVDSKECKCLYCGKEFPTNRSNQKFCDNKCQKEFEYVQYIRDWKNGYVDGTVGEYAISRHIKRYMMEKHNCCCELCGWNKTNVYTNTIPLEIHHIDGDYTNNKEDNLQLLCPNCHSLTPTHKSHNKNGRIGRNKYYNKSV